MRAFVTGGSGFIGGHLVESLVGRGFAVTTTSKQCREISVIKSC
jgi:nucleoside-diphosphate-sugar epimerase